MALDEPFSLSEHVALLAPRLSSSDALAKINELARRHATNLVQIVRERQISSGYTDPRLAVEQLLRQSGWSELESVDRFLSANPHDWAIFSEPQITGGWQYFLTSRHSLQRCQAAFDASWLDAQKSRQLASIEAVEAEVGRIDLLVIGELEDLSRVALCIEAKFGHVLTEGQLEDYKCKLSENHKIDDLSMRTLLILAPSMRSDVRSQLRHGENEWLFNTWRQWLIRYENALPAEYDDPEFQRFRRTTLERARLELFS